ncbi:MAG: hypothetical protein R3D71_01760 [Rickettsiales bacterium]
MASNTEEQKSHIQAVKELLGSLLLIESTRYIYHSHNTNNEGVGTDTFAISTDHNIDYINGVLNKIKGENITIKKTRNSSDKTTDFAIYFIDMPRKDIISQVDKNIVTSLKKDLDPIIKEAIRKLNGYTRKNFEEALTHVNWRLNDAANGKNCERALKELRMEGVPEKSISCFEKPVNLRQLTQAVSL